MSTRRNESTPSECCFMMTFLMNVRRVLAGSKANVCTVWGCDEEREMGNVKLADLYIRSLSCNLRTPFRLATSRLCDNASTSPSRIFFAHLVYCQLSSFGMSNMFMVSIVRDSLTHGTLASNPMSYSHASLTVERDVQEICCT